MLAGELYDALDPDLVRDRNRARDLCQTLNATRESDREIRRQILLQLFGKGGDTVWMQPPFFCDYGSNIELGERVFFNFNCVVLDVCPVKIGDFTLFGPSVQVLTPWVSSAGICCMEEAAQTTLLASTWCPMEGRVSPNRVGTQY